MTRRERWEHWESVVRDWQSSGQSKAAYCRSHDIRAWQFYSWCRRVADREVESSAGFALVDNALTDSGVRVHLDGGIELSLSKDFDESTLQRLLCMSCWSC